MQPIFICGINRSGTHLLFSLLSGHSRLFVTGMEDEMISALASAGGEFEAAFEGQSLGKLYRALLAHSCLPALKLIALRGKRIFDHSQGSFNSTFDFDMAFHEFEEDFLGRLSEENFSGLSVDGPAQVLDAFYVSLATAFGEERKSFVVSKPGTGAQGFVAASRFFGGREPKTLYMLRDPRAVACSQTRGGPGVLPHAQEWSADLVALEILKALFPVHVVRHEELCLDTKREMEKVADFLGIGFEEALLEPSMRGKEFTGNSSLETSSGGVSTSSVERWKDLLPPAAVQSIENEIGPEMLKAGYAPLTPPSLKQRLRTIKRALR